MINEDIPIFNQQKSIIMAVRTQFENSSEVGVFAKLTNTYCLTAVGACENFYR